MNQSGYPQIDHNAVNQINNYSDGLFIHQKDNGFQEGMQTSAHNLSFTNLNQISFEIEDHVHGQPSPIQQQTAYLPSSLLSKPFDEENYEASYSARGGSQTPSARFNWPNSVGFTYNNHINPVMGNNFNQNDNFGSLNYSCQPLWDSQEHPPFIDQDPIISHNYSFNNEALGGCFTEQNKSLKPSNNTLKAVNSSQVFSNCIDAMEEEVNPTEEVKELRNIEQAESCENSSLIFGKNAVNNIVMDYENYQGTIKTGGGLSTPEKYQEYRHFDNLYSHLVSDLNFIGDISPTPKNHFSSLLVDSLDHNQFFNSLNMASAIPKIPETDLFGSNEPEDMIGEIQKLDCSNVDDQLQEEQRDQPIQQNSTQLQTNTVSQGIDLSQLCICNCKKTKCLKLYCECFAKLGYCGIGCHCHECKNKPEFEEDRAIAITEAKQRNSEAFVPKVLSESELIAEQKRRLASQNAKKGCNCRKTKCLKKYCECFNAGQFCDTFCKCENCENTEGNLLLLQQKRGGIPSILMNQHTTSVSTLMSSASSYLVSNNLERESFTVGTPNLPLSLQSYKYQLEQKNSQNSHTHMNLLGFANQDSNVLGIKSDDQTPSNYLKEKASQQIIEGYGEESDQISSSSSSVRNTKFKINKTTKGFLSALKKMPKKPIIKPRADNSDEDLNSTSSMAASEYRQRQTRRIKNKSEAALSNDEDMILQQQIEDMEKKLKQIQQVQHILVFQQQLQEEKAQIETTSNVSYSVPDATTQVELSQTLNTINNTNTQVLEEKTLELLRQKQQLALTLQFEQQLLIEQSNINRDINEMVSENSNDSNELSQQRQEQQQQIEKQEQSDEKKKPRKKSKAIKAQFSGEKSEIVTSASVSFQDFSSVAQPEQMEEESYPSAQSQEQLQLEENTSSKRVYPRKLRQSQKTLFQLQQIAPTAKESEILFDPSTFNYGAASENNSRASKNSSLKQKRNPNVNNNNANNNNILLQAP